VDIVINREHPSRLGLGVSICGCWCTKALQIQDNKKHCSMFQAFSLKVLRLRIDLL
jgi:hypothetical protein